MMKPERIHFFLVLMLAASALPFFTHCQEMAVTSNNPATSYGPLKSCNIKGVEEELLCGKLSVFENRQAQTGRKIDLNVVVLPALDQNGKREPLFRLTGGPGTAATAMTKYYATSGREYRLHRDVVLVDQRGTGASNNLGCRDIEKPGYLGEMYPVRYVQDCRRKLERSADLTQYTTPIAMDDSNDVRAWLGYQEINLIGLSYGTRAVLVYMRQHPEHVHSAILMGVVPTYSKLPMYHATSAQRSMDLLFDECAADAACNKAYPRIRVELTELLTKLGKHPARVKYGSPSEKREVEIDIRRDMFAEDLRNQMYAPVSARHVPFIIHRAAQGDFIPFLKIAIPNDPSFALSNFLADGMYLSITCAEDVPLINLAEAEQLNRGTFFRNYRVDQQRRACQYWPRAKMPAGYDNPVVSGAPVLIISGYMDPVTPPDWGAEVASHVPNSKQILVRHHAHSWAGLSNAECFDKLILEFLKEGAVKDLDTSCTEKMLPPSFFVEANTPSLSAADLVKIRTVNDAYRSAIDIFLPRGTEKVRTMDATVFGGIAGQGMAESARTRVNDLLQWSGKDRKRLQ